MIKIAFISVLLMGTLAATNAFAEEDCLTANAERPDREAYCFKQAQDAALQATKDKLNQDFQNSFKKNKPQPTEPGTGTPEDPNANPTPTPKTTDNTPAPPVKNEITTPNSTTVTTPTEQTVKPGSDEPAPDAKRVLPKPKTHPPIQYY